MPLTIAMTLMVLSQPLVTPFDHASLLDPLSMEEAGVTGYWEAWLPLEWPESVEHAYLLDEALYVTTDAGKVFSVHAEMGLIRWGIQLTEPELAIHRPSHVRTKDGRGPVIFPTTDRIEILDRFTGDRLRSFRPDFAVSGGVVGADHRLYVGGADGRFRSLLVGDPRSAVTVTLWEVSVGATISANPILTETNGLLFTTDTGGVYACRAANKALVWSFQVGAAVYGNPVLDAGGVYVASMDRSLYKLDRRNGSPVWRVRFPDPLREGPVVRSHTVYQYCRDQGITAVDSDTGDVRWRVDAARSFVAHDRDRDFLLAADGNLLVVEHRTGSLLHTVYASGVSLSIANSTDESVYLLGRDGRILCARPNPVPYLRLQQIAAARASLNQAPSPDKSDAASTPIAPRTRDGRRDPLRSRWDRKP